MGGDRGQSGEERSTPGEKLSEEGDMGFGG